MIGARLGPWVIDEELGRGGMGHVYRAHGDPAPAGRPAVVAVKILAAELAAEAGFLQRFRREIEILRKLDHPNIVRFFEAGEQGGRYYFAMEYVDGPSLQTAREEKEKLAWPEVLELALQIAPALKHAHDRGVIHRDVKPSNLLRASSGAVKLSDFGIASLFASRHLTVTGGIVGTAEYLSPEQAAGKPVTRRSDLYSFGVVLYTLLTGRTPFEGEVLDLLHKHRFAQFDRPGRLAPEIPADFDDIVCELLEKDPSRRPADGMVLYRRLDRLRRKIEYRTSAGFHDAPTNPGLAPGATAPSGHEGPATLMSRLMREELDRQKQGGPVKRLLNHPWVLLALFLLTLGTIVWTFWPASPEALFRRGAALMASDDPDEWQRAWREYLGPLQEKYPDGPHREELDEFRRKIDAWEADRKAAESVRDLDRMSEAQWFFQEGLRRQQRGDEDGARRVWRALVAAFREVPSEGRWVGLAEKELGKGPGEKPAVERKWGPVREAVRRAKELQAEGKAREAKEILDALGELYRDDSGAEKVLKED
jgi:serine/threonine-protein kinase